MKSKAHLSQWRQSQEGRQASDTSVRSLPVHFALLVNSQVMPSITK